MDTILWKSKNSRWYVIKTTYPDKSFSIYPARWIARKTWDGAIRYWEDATWDAPNYVLIKAGVIARKEARK